MTTETSATTIQADIVVEATIDRAFRVFTEGFDRIKPREHNLLAVEIEASVLEQRVGGHIYDRGVDGSECRWARILAYEPPERLVFTWEISPQWQLQADHGRASEVEVRFIAETADRTRVEIEHRHLNRHLDGWEALRDGIAGDQGWPLYLRRFAEAARA